MSDERRGDERFLTCVAASVEHDASRARSALIEDISVSGARLLTRARVEPEHAVRLDIRLSNDGIVMHVDARVVRVEAVNNPMWTRRVAVVFDELATQYEEAFKTLAAQRALSGIDGP